LRHGWIDGYDHCGPPDSSLKPMANSLVFNDSSGDFQTNGNSWSFFTQNLYIEVLDRPPRPQGRGG
ncbi:MAG: hypothetical protein MI717_06250, partial [Spirochaetales bacterium]|nr:hypothetical protein [Spirochaetales bacterium]